MAKKKEIYNGKYITYEDQQSLEETHDMMVKALPGQSYVKETMHKVSTTQVTGEALMKVSVGGKGGFAAGTAGDVREKKKELNAELVRMEKKEVWMQRFEVMLTLGIKRDYDDFTHQNELDPSDHMRDAEFHLAGTESLKRIRAAYEEICGYKGAWKYVGLNGAEHRRYQIVIVNTLNMDTAKDVGAPYKRDGYMNWEGSSYNHHIVGPNYELYHDMKDGNVRKDCIAYTMMQLERSKPEFWGVIDYNWLDEEVIEPSEDFLRMKKDAEELERKRRLEAKLKAPDLRDWRKVYNWELTKQGKTMFANEKI